jgi:acetoin utilization deacetylase AcuC-like enzyme
VKVFYSDQFVVDLPAKHRFPMGKYARVRDAVMVLPLEMIAAQPASRDDILRVHDAAYVDAFLDGSIDPKMMREIGLPWSPALVARTLGSAGGTLAAMRDALATGIAGNLAGGTHHAHRAKGSGFCVFNDLAIAAAAALDLGRRTNVFDTDVHQGDGTAAIFADEPRVFTCSIHGRHNFPFRKMTSDLDVELADGAGDAEFLDAVRNAWAVAMRSAPDLILYQAGVDPLAEDTLGRLSVTREGLAARDRFVLTSARDAGIPIVLTLGGGYADPLEASIAAHAQTYAIAIDVFR